jgi:hypothetical protein
MGYALGAWLHAMAVTALGGGRAGQRGQGTVEYVGVVVMVTLLIAAVAVAAKGWAPDVGKSLKAVIIDAMEKASKGV